MAAVAPAVFDAHVDALQRALDHGHDLGERTSGHFDLPRAREGGVGAAVLVAWVDAPYAAVAGASRRRAEALLGAAEALARRHPAELALARSGADLDLARASGRIAGFLGIEGGHALEGSLEVLRELHERGLRCLTLVWNNHLPWIRSCRGGAGAGIPEGLSAFGREIVREMGRLGVVADLSHAGERSFRDALETGDAPPIASHSGCRRLHDHPRNLTDEALRALASRGGVVGIVFCPPFLGSAGEAPLPLARVADHVLHACEVAGVDHVGIGSDFDGIESTPVGLEDASRFPALADELRRRRLGEDDIAKVMGANFERVFRTVTRP